MDNLVSFAEGKLSVVAVALLIAGFLARCIVFGKTLREDEVPQDGSKRRYLVNLARALFPLHRIMLEKPCYTASRYLFHLCLLLALVGASSHVSVLRELQLGWLYRGLPETLTDRVTVVLIFCLAYFLIRKISFSSVRESSTKSEGFFVAGVAIPVVSGYVSHHAWLDYETMIAVHMISGAAVIVGMIFLFCRTTVATEKCTGCKACSVSCPTGALQAVDKGANRVFEYSHYQCVCCATCISSCPEGAVTLRHRLGFKYAIERHRVPERVMPLHSCEECGQTFTSDNQLEQIGRMIREQGLELSSLGLCERCKKRSALVFARPSKSRNLIEIPQA